MSDPRRRGAPGSDPVGRSRAADAASVVPTEGGDWPPHPWAAVVDRYAGDRDEEVGAPELRVTIVWWTTRAGRQPVLLVRRIRYD